MEYIIYDDDKGIGGGGGGGGGNDGGLVQVHYHQEPHSKKWMKLLEG